MTRALIISLLLSCGGDISIITVDKNQDTAIIAEPETYDTQDSNSNEPSSQDSGNSNSDLTIGYAEIHFRQIACQQCMGVNSEFDITATLKLHQPTSGDYFAYMQEPGTCTTQLIETYVSSTPLPATQPALFNDISLNPISQGEWSGSIYEYQYIRNTNHTINTEHAIISNAFTSIEGFDDIQPYTLLWVDPSYAFDTPISKSGTTFNWLPVLPNDQFEIIVAVYSPDGSQFLGAVSCLEHDVGYMTIPGSYFQQFPYYSLAAVHFMRHRTDSVQSEQLNGYLQSHMIWEVVGTGHIE